MAVLDLDRLFSIVEVTPMLEHVEKALFNGGHRLEETYLHKLQTDAGVQIDREMNKFDSKAPPPGPQTALLNQTFAPVTEARLIVLAQAHALLPVGDLKNDVFALMQNLAVNPLPRPSPYPPAFAP